MIQKPSYTGLQRQQPLYEPAEIYMLRSPAFPATLFTTITQETSINARSYAQDQDLDDVLNTQQQKCYHLLQDLIDRPSIRLALEVASPSLLEGIAHNFQKKHNVSPRAARSYASLLRYLIRMSTRPTPFGLFAGIAVGTFGSQTTLSLATPAIQQTRIRPDMDWLLAVLQKIEENPLFLPQLRLRANQTLYFVGKRVVLPYADIYGRADNRTISLNATSVVSKVLELTQQEISYIDLRTIILQTFPQATEEQVDILLRQLWEHHFLLSDLHPSLIEVSPFEYIYRRLERLEGAEQIRDTFQSIMLQSAIFDIYATDDPINSFHALNKELHQMSFTEQRHPPLQIDSVLRLQSKTLQKAVGETAAYAAELLLRLSPLPQGWPHLQEYRAHFLRRYGEHAEIPLLDLLSSEKGLDAPDTYEHPLPSYQRHKLLSIAHSEKRERFLQRIVAGALNSHSMEVELTEPMLRQIEQWQVVRKEAPSSLEIYLQIQAKSQAALDRGEFCAVVSRNCGSLAAGCTFGRFFDLLDKETLDQLSGFARREELFHPHAILAELSYQPRGARMANLTIRPALYSYEIAIGITPSVPPDHVISLNELVVGIKNGRFYLRSLRLGKQIIVRANHMLNIRSAPNICRFLSEIGGDGVPILQSFSWGNLVSMPFLPRIIVKTGSASTLVLSPAQWHVTQDSVIPTGSGSERARWFRGLQEWREHWHVPRYVYLTESDRRLLIDLEHPILVHELSQEVAHHHDSGITLQEMLPDFDHLWFHDEQGSRYFSEFVTPLFRHDADSLPATQIQTYSLPEHGHIISPKERNQYPGMNWCYFKWYAAYQQHDALIAGPIRTIAQELWQQEKIDRWFFLRYADPEPHLRLRFHSKQDETTPSLLTFLLQWSQHLAQEGTIRTYCLDTYEREVERYGGPAAIDLIEQIFSIDSLMVCNSIFALDTQQLVLDPIALAIFTLDHFFDLWGLKPEQRLQWLLRYTEKYALKEQFRPLRKWYSELLDPIEQQNGIASQRTSLLAILELDTALLHNLALELEQLATSGELWTPLEAIWRSLAHMHCNRLLGASHQQERQIYQFWRYALESRLFRPAPAKE
jgi:thiopeptide-type bacteriocin biosynthesis protein